MDTGKRCARLSHADAFVTVVELAWNMHNAKHAKTKYQQPKPITKKQGVKRNKQWVNVIKKWKIALSLRVLYALPGMHEEEQHSNKTQAYNIQIGNK